MRLLCFGDSNTYGYDPRSYFGGRYAAESRWVDLLAQKSGWEVVNAGENGREIPREPGELHRFAQLLSDSQPLDLLLVMLGSNDLLQGADIDGVTDRMEAFLIQIPLERQRLARRRPYKRRQSFNVKLNIPANSGYLAFATVDRAGNVNIAAGSIR